MNLSELISDGDFMANAEDAFYEDYDYNDFPLPAWLQPGWGAAQNVPDKQDEVRAGEASNHEKEKAEEVNKTASALDAQDAEKRIAQVMREKLPLWFRDKTAAFTDDREMVIALLSAIIVSGGVLPKVWCNYDRGRVYGQLYLIVLMPPAGGKGVVAYTKSLLSPIDKECLATEFRTEYAAYKKAEQDSKLGQGSITVGGVPLSPPAVPCKPKRKGLLTSGNITNSKLITHAANNGDLPVVIVETEADVIGTSFSSEHGKGLSSTLRLAWQHESVSYERVSHGDEEPVEVGTPKFALVLAGTDNQLKTIFKGNGDGLYSRFMIIQCDFPIKWRDVQPKEGKVLIQDMFEEWGKDYLTIFPDLRSYNGEVRFTQPQWDRINFLGTDAQAESHLNGGEYAVSLARRHALIVARLAMILSVFRQIDPKTCLVSTKPVIVCHDDDFEVATLLSEYSFNHSLNLFTHMVTDKHEILVNNTRKKFLSSLPVAFSTAEAVSLALALNVSERTAKEWLKKFCDTGKLRREKQGHYTKP